MSGGQSKITYLNTSHTEFLKLNKFTDVTLVCGASELRAHKAVLSAGSLYFDKYFRKYGNADEIVLDVDVVDMKCILLYIYQGVIVFPAKRKKSFLKLANRFQVNIKANQIFDVGSRLMQVNGNEYNETSFEQDAGDYDGTYTRTTELVHVNFNEVDTTYQNEAEQLDADDSDKIAILSQSDIKVTNSNQIVSMTLKEILKLLLLFCIGLLLLRAWYLKMKNTQT